jgi:hypothetical protein
MAKSKKTTDNIKLVLESKTGNPTRTYGYEIKHFARLGKEIKVSPKANASFHPPGYRTEFFVDTVSVVIGIGNNHVADLVMSEAAWNDLQKGEKVNIVTTEDFKKKYVYKKKLLNK